MGVKNEAKKIFKEIGVDLSSGIKLFLSQVINTGSIPFNPITKNGFTEVQEKQILRETSEVLTFGKSYKNARSLHKALQ